MSIESPTNAAAPDSGRKKRPSSATRYAAPLSPASIKLNQLAQPRRPAATARHQPPVARQSSASSHSESVVQKLLNENDTLYRQLEQLHLTVSELKRQSSAAPLVDPGLPADERASSSGENLRPPPVSLPPSAGAKPSSGAKSSTTSSSKSPAKAFAQPPASSPSPGRAEEEATLRVTLSELRGAVAAERASLEL